MQCPQNEKCVVLLENRGGIKTKENKTRKAQEKKGEKNENKNQTDNP